MISIILLDSGRVPIDQVQKFLGLLQLSTNVSKVVATLFILTPKGKNRSGNRRSVGVNQEGAIPQFR